MLDLKSIEYMKERNREDTKEEPNHLNTEDLASVLLAQSFPGQFDAS